MEGVDVEVMFEVYFQSSKGDFVLFDEQDTLELAIESATILQQKHATEFYVYQQTTTVTREQMKF